MTTMTIAEAQARLPDLIRGLAPGEEVAIIDNNFMVAQAGRQRRRNPALFLDAARGC